MKEGSRKPPRALVWGPAGAMAMRDGRARRIGSGRDSMGTGQEEGSRKVCSPRWFYNYSYSKGSSPKHTHPKVEDKGIKM